MYNELGAFILMALLITIVIIRNAPKATARAPARASLTPVVVDERVVTPPCVLGGASTEEEERKARARAYAQRFGVPQGFRVGDYN